MTAASPPERQARLVWTLALLMALLFVYAWDRAVLAITLPELGRDIGLDGKQAGLIATIFSLGMAIIALPAGLIVRRFGLKTVLVAGAAIFSTATLYPPLARGFTDLLLSRVLLGFGEGIFNVGLLLYLGSVMPDRRAFAIGLSSTIFGIAMMAGPPIITWFNAATGDWRPAYYALSGAGIVLALLLTRVSARDIQLSPATASPHNAPAIEPAKIWRFWPMLLLIAAHGLGAYSLSGMLPVWLRGHLDFSAEQAGLALGAAGAGAMIGGAPLGLIVDRFARRRYVLWIGTIYCIVAVLTMALAAPAIATIILAFLAGTAAQSLYVSCMALAQDRTSDERSAVVGSMVTVYYGAASVSGLALVVAGEVFGFQLGALLFYGAIYGVGLTIFGLFWREGLPPRGAGAHGPVEEVTAVISMDQHPLEGKR